MNTRPLLFRKTGVGYYVSNLYTGLLARGDVEVLPTIDVPSARILRLMSMGAQALRRVLGDSVLRVSVPVGDYLVSRKENRCKPAGGEIFHETLYDTIPAGAHRSVANIYDLSFLHCPRYLPEKLVGKFTANLGNISKADRLIVNSESVKEEVIDLVKLPGERIDVIPLAPSGPYRPVNRETAEGRERVKRFTERDYILYVGTIEPRKNIPVLLKAFRLLGGAYDIGLIIAGGKGWLYDEILKMPRGLGIQNDTIFTGYLDKKDILYLYNYASAVVYPSLYEGFGLPVVEAMSCGVPVIVSDIPSLREVGGDAVLTFNPADPEDLAQKIGSVLSSPSLSRELSGKALLRSSAYSWDKVIGATIATYRKALEN